MQLVRDFLTERIESSSDNIGDGLAEFFQERFMKELKKWDGMSTLDTFYDTDLLEVITERTVESITNQIEKVKREHFKDNK